MKNALAPVLLAVFVVGSGCYHATFITGKPPSDTIVEDQWATSFIGGLVPPDEIDVSAECPNGVAVVESQLSFLNMVATIVTFNIFSPMHLKVTCAAGGMSSVDDASAVDVAQDVNEAVDVDVEVSVDPPTVEP